MSYGKTGKRNPKTISVDYDGCLCAAKCPDIGEPRWQVIRALAREQANGAKLILWTCREGAQLQEAVLWCLNHGLEFDAVNDNLEENKAFFGNNSRKVWASEYWDDKSVTVSVGVKGAAIAFPRKAGGITLKRWRRKSLPVKTAVSELKEERKPKKRRWLQWFDGLRRDSDLPSI